MKRSNLTPLLILIMVNSNYGQEISYDIIKMYIETFEYENEEKFNSIIMDYSMIEYSKELASRKKFKIGLVPEVNIADPLYYARFKLYYIKKKESIDLSKLRNDGKTKYREIILRQFYSILLFIKIISNSNFKNIIKLLFHFEREFKKISFKMNDSNCYMSIPVIEEHIISYTCTVKNFNTCSLKNILFCIHRHHERIDNCICGFFFENKFINNVRNEINKNNLETILINSEKKNEEQIKICKITIYALLLLLFFSLTTISYLIWKKKTTPFFILQRKKQEKEAGKEKRINQESLTRDIISYETEFNILKGLEKFENKLQFRQKGITQGILASQLKTNVRYLSLVIKRHKSDNFNLYINKLRVEYIVKKMEVEDEYRKYKISYLAEDAGFSTSGLFTKSFKEITGVTPSAYRDLLYQNNGNEKN
ncbi:MAG: helix-turn-helix domain-containing protein [Flavobacteriaceae bacterium]|jgi:AraC-like DNA-binding protein|nr:helix-turn-helix domain-containing protein [Flavobacteriaceae bacterium]